MRYAFDDLVLDDETFELRRDGELVAVEPQVFDVLRHLIVHRDRVVEKTELLDSVWGDQFVSESALSTRIKQARQAVGDDGKRQQVIRTAHGRGYRFVAAVATDGEAGSGGGSAAVDGAGPDGDGAMPDTTTIGQRAIRRPRPVGAIQGRDAMAAAIERRLDTRRLVTLVGMGGIGKTHLLHHLGHRLADRYADGAVLVELAPVRSGGAVGAALLDAVGGTDRAAVEPAEAAVDWLADRRVLLLIDNAEHVRSEVAELCRTILRRCDGIELVVTSRERLNVVGESVQPVGPLSDEAATALFVDRAYDAGVDLDGDRSDVRELCARLDGVPLAIEILAARAPLLSITDLAADLERNLGATHLDGDEHHRTLEAAMRSSFDSLAELERRLLEDLTVFAGSFDLDAAEVVSGLDAVTEPLLDLCRRSLVVANPGASDSRFRLLEPVRLFAASTNAAIDDARQRHADHYLAVAEWADEVLRTAAIDDGLDRLTIEWPNLRAAFETAEQTGDVDAMTRLLLASVNYAEARILVEVHDWADRVDAAARSADRELTPELLATRARFAVHHAELDLADRLLDEVEPTLTSNHVRMGFIARDWYRGRIDDVLDRLDPAIEEARGDGGYWELSLTMLRVMASPAAGQRPEHLVDRLTALAGGGPTPALFARLAAAVRLHWSGRPEEAIAVLDEAIALAEARGHTGFAQLGHLLRTGSQRAAGDRRRAAADVASSLARGLESGGQSIVVDSLTAAAAILVDGGRPELAARILASRQAAGYRSGGADHGPLIDRVTEVLGQEEIAVALEEGRRLELAAAITLAVDGLRELAAGG